MCRRFLPGPTAGKDLDSAMTNMRSLTISATVTLLLVAGGGCADDGNDSGTTGSPSPSSAPPSSTTSTPLTDSEQAGADASSVVRNYFSVVDALRQQPDKPLDPLKTVTTGSQLSAQQNLVGGERKKDRRQVGDTAIAELKVQTVNLDNSDPSTGKVPTVTIDVCWDVSNVDIVDSSGKSVVSPDRPPTGWTRYTLTNYKWADDPAQGWRIATGQDLKQKPCAAS